MPKHGARKPAIVTTVSRKRARLLRAEEQATAAEPEDHEAPEPADYEFLIARIL